MKTVVTASTNPAKLEAVELAFSAIFPHEEFQFFSAAAASGVSRQPCSDEETRSGAWNRASAVRVSHPEADFWVGIEGGVEALRTEEAKMSAFCWVVIHGAERTGQARSGMFILPDKVSRLIMAGMEMGEADDLVFGQKNSKQGPGGVGLLTRGVLTRSAYYAQAIQLALIPFLNPELYPLQPEESRG